MSNENDVRGSPETTTQGYFITLKCGRKIALTELESAGLSYVPCARQTNDKGELEDRPFFAYAHLWGQRSQVRLSSYGRKANAWAMAKWHNSEFPGVQLMTGNPTYRHSKRTTYLYYTSIDIETHMIESYPEQVAEIQELYEASVDGTPCILATKSGGLRLDAYTEYVGKKMSFKDDDGMLLEILADKCLVRIDSRYSMIQGNILEMPTLPKKALQDIHHILSEIATIEESGGKPREVVERSQLGDLAIEWGKDGRSQYFPAQLCQATSHTSTRDTVRFTKHDDGSVDGICFNCGGTWWEIEPQRKPKRRTLQEIIDHAPPIEVRESPSFQHFSKEEKAVVDGVLGISPDAGWHGQTPVFTTRYEYLHPLTQKFKLNGQPSEVEKRRVWSTLFGNCEICGAVTAEWVDRYLLTAGRYCDGCHKDYPLGSYLELELNRKLPNSIVSAYQGFLGDDPEFQDFRLWEPGMLTHLGAGMATGKSTEIYKAMIALATQGLGKGIIAVPLVALARFLAYLLRHRDGARSWGVWHEGCPKSDRFIGDYGAIVCLPSLPRVVEWAEDAGINDRLYLAIDEVDFGYNLLSLAVEQSTAVKKCIRDALFDKGLVVSGQTESTLALEAFAEELACEQIQAFYNTAKPADGSVVMHKHPNVDRKSNSILCGAIDDISDALSAGHNVYSFNSSRRDGDIIAKEFASETPVVYNAYTKGTTRADAVLRNQRLTDSRLFIGTSAAGVGISILDPKALTVVTSGLKYGSRDASMSVQEHVRDRGRCGGSFHYSDYDLPLPVRPTENEKVSLYHEALKQASLKTQQTAGIRKIAYAQALSTLADIQIENFIAYHLGVVGNMPVYQASAIESEPERIDAISACRAEIRRDEKEKRITLAIEFLKTLELLTTSEIRVMSNQGELSVDDRLAHETANAAAQAVGWDNTIHAYHDGEPIKEMPGPEDIGVAIVLVAENINTEKLTKQRRGYLAHQFPKWTADQFQADLENADSQLVLDGAGLEITAINDDRFLGGLLTVLLDRLTGNVFDAASLATAVREVLDADCSTGRTFRSEIVSGALGASAYRKARFLHITDDDRVVDWIKGFIAEWYPARIAKNGDAYTLTHVENLDLRLASFARWLRHQRGVPESTKLDLGIFEATVPPDPNAELKNVARSRREGGEAIKEIAESMNLHPNTVSKWCKGIKPLSPAQRDVLNILSDGAVWKKSDIEARSRFAGQNVRTAIKILLDANMICKIKRGHYQKKEVKHANPHAICN